MKILALTNLYPPHYLGGYELIGHMVLGELRARGHQIQILTSNHKKSGVEVSDEGSDISRLLRIHGFYGHPWLNFLNLRKLEKHNNLTLRNAIDQHNPDLVYVWNMGGLSKSMVLTLQQLGIPTVFYLSDHWIARGFTADVWLQCWNRPEKNQAKKLLRKLAELSGHREAWQRIAPTNPVKHLRFNKLYFCSKALRKLTASAGFEVMHGAVIYPPVDLTKFNGPPKPSNQPVRELLWVGRLSEDKGIMTALKSMAALKGKFDGALRVYGDGDPTYKTELETLVQTHNLPVTFHTADMRQMPAIYQNHDALLFTSEWAEPFALTPLEAMASGLPVIGTTTGGSREIFRHDDNCLTYTAGNADELASRILQLAQNTASRARIATTGCNEVKANYALPVIVDQIESYLMEAFKTWTPARLPHYSE